MGRASKKEGEFWQAAHILCFGRNFHELPGFRIPTGGSSWVVWIGRYSQELGQMLYYIWSSVSHWVVIENPKGTRCG